jgi:hypothetical protein
MFVAGATGFILDNTISGTDEERGFSKRIQAERDAELFPDATYDIPYVMDWIRR